MYGMSDGHDFERHEEQLLMHQGTLTPTGLDSPLVNGLSPTDTSEQLPHPSAMQG